MNKYLKYLSVLTFFGLTPEYKVELHRTLHDYLYYTEGKVLTFTEIYNMPIPLRAYYIKLFTDKQK